MLRTDGRAFARTEIVGTGHAERVAPMVADLLDAAGLSARELTRLGVTVGPGSFMGARVGLSFAKGLALPGSLPCVPFATTEAIALGLPRPLTVLIDARRGQAYAHRIGEDEPSLLPASEAVLVAAGGPVAGVGLGALGLEGEDRFPDTALMAEAALTRAPGRLSPLYLRAPDAKPPSRPPL